MKNGQLHKTAGEIIKDCLSGISFIRMKSIDPSPDNSSADLIILLETPLGQKELCVEISNNGQPRYARTLIDKLGFHNGGIENYWIFAAPFISEKTGEMLRGANIGFIDFAGNCYISFDGIHIQKEGKENPFYTKRQFKSLFRLKASRVLRTLLSNPNKYWKIDRLAKEARVSTGHAFNIKEELLNREWAEFSNKGLKLTEAKKLLQEWSHNYQIEKQHCLGFYSLLTTSQLEDRIKKVCAELKLRYALSGLAGAFRLVPFVRYHRVNFYVEDAIEKIVALLDLKTVTSGENVILTIPPDDSIFCDTQMIEGIRVVSPIQLYLDLKTSGDRGNEAADFIYNEVIEPQWKKTA